MGSKNKNRNKKKARQNAERFDNTQITEENSKQLEENEAELCDDRVSTNSNSNTKRHHDDNCSDNEEDKPRKKKKKQPLISDTSERKGKKSIRQMKREKFAQRQSEAKAMMKDQFKKECLNYLSQWKHDKPNWKFMKVKQVWLFKNKFSNTLLPDSTWPLLLEYFNSAQGNIRKILLDDAKKVINQMDEWMESQTAESIENNDNDDDGETESKPKKPDEHVYKRARDLIQCLEE